jgi:PqqD family protein of HPr-rel-A system
MNSIPSLRSGLLRHPLDEQVLVYDQVSDRVHLLDPTTACVMNLLEKGVSSEQELIDEVSAQLSVNADRDLVSLAISELREADLLESTEIGDAGSAYSRRDVVRKLAAAGIAGILVPTISTLAASRAYGQDGTVLGVGAACAQSSQCLQGTGRCCGGLCRAAACTGAGGSCGPGVTPPSSNNATIVDCTCCSGVCQRSGNSANFSCQ